MTNTKKRFGALLAAVLLMLTLLAGCAPAGDPTDLSDLKKAPIDYKPMGDKGTLTPAAADIEGKKLAQENDYLALYYAEETAAVSVFDKRTGEWWHSNPADGEMAAAKSQITVNTISSAGVIGQFTSFADSLQKNQVTFEVKDGLHVTYVFGTPRPDLSSVPYGFTLTRYNELVARAKAVGANDSLLKRRFVQNGDRFTRKPNLPVKQAKELAELFAAIDYTEEELRQDNEESGVTLEEEPDNSFTIPLHYVLEGDSMRVYVAGTEIDYPEDALITSMDVLEYFGAMKKGNKTDWFLIPDGSGALVNADVRSGSTGQVSLPLFGREEALPQSGYSPLGEKCLLPLFGLHRENGGVLTVIEDSEAIARLDVVKPGFVDNFGTVSIGFELNATQNIGLATDSISKFYITSETLYEGDAAMRYIFLSKEKADYSGMASVYRNYLDLSGERAKLSGEAELPMFLETIGAIDTEISTLGFVHETLVPMTTYEDNVTLIKLLKEKGVDRIELSLAGWMNGGENPTLANEIDLIRVLGGKEGFQNLLNYAKDNNVGVYPQVKLNTFSPDESLSVINNLSSRNLASKKSSVAGYDVVTSSSIGKGMRYLLSPAYLKSVVSDLMVDVKAQNITGLNVTDLGKTAYSDFNEDNEVTREASRLQAAAVIKDMASQLTGGVMLTSPNELAARHSQLFTDVPKSSSSLSLAFASVPFYQMVYHGYANYSFTAINYDADFNRALLKCAEYGGCPKFQFIFREDDRLSFDDDADYYAAYYERWLDSAAESYTFLEDLLEPVQNAVMVNHTSLATEVYRTDYDNGMSIFVNYSDADFTLEDGTVIKAASAMRKEGV